MHSEFEGEGYNFGRSGAFFSNESKNRNGCTKLSQNDTFCLEKKTAFFISKLHLYYFSFGIVNYVPANKNKIK